MEKNQEKLEEKEKLLEMLCEQIEENKKLKKKKSYEGTNGNAFSFTL